jgi:hypothetical protein
MVMNLRVLAPGVSEWVSALLHYFK